MSDCGLTGLEWIHLAKDRKEWWAVVYTVMNFLVS